MRIGIDARPLSRQRAGIGTYVYNIVKNLNKLDKENEYYLFSCREVFIDFELEKNWHIVVEDYKVGTFWLLNRGSFLIKKYNIDVFWGTQHVLPFGKVKNVKYVLTICDLAQFRIKNIGSAYNSIIQKFFVKNSCKKADKILAISEATKYDIVDIFGIEAYKIACTYLGGTDKVEIPQLSEINDVREKFQVKEDYFLFVSTIEPRKNVDTIIEAFNLLKERYNTECKLVLAGGLGWKYESTIRKIEKSKYSKDIIRTGFVSAKEKQCLFAGACAFIYPSLYEGFGIPLLEAMNYGLPIITTNVSSLPEVGGGAVMYMQGVHDAPGLCELMNTCLGLTTKERSEYKELDEKQRNLFSWEKCSRETLSFLTE